MHLQNFSGSLNKGRIWWYNILGDNEGSISHLLRLDPISACSVSLTSKIVALKRKNTDLILIVKRTERKKFIDYFGLSIESEPSRVGKKNVCFFLYWVYTNPFIYASPYIKATAGQRVEFITTKATSVSTTKKSCC